MEDDCNARVVLSMNDKGEEIVRNYEKATGRTPRVQSTPGKPGEVLVKNVGETIQHEDYRSIL